MKEKKKIGWKSSKDIYNLFLILIVLLLIIGVVNIILLSLSGGILNLKIKEIKEANKPANIELVSIKTAACTDCFDLSHVIESVKGKNVKVVKEETLLIDSDKAKELIDKYSIDKAPVLLILGEIDKLELNGFENIKDALVFNQIRPLYVDVRTNEIRGKVSIINVLDSSCKECVSLSPVLDSLGQAGVIVSDIKNFEYNSTDGKELISKFGIKHIPAILISNDINYYEDIKQSLAQLTEEKNGFYAIHSVIPPYRNLSTNKIDGLVKLTILVDEQCKDCYDVSVHKSILERFGVYLSEEQTVDYLSDNGKNLVSKYKIKKIPTIILSKEAAVYDDLNQAWEQVGTVEEDGSYIFRSVELMGTYKDLESGSIVTSK